MGIVIYPGNFDPFTLGHLALIQRGIKLFGGLTLLVMNSQGRNYRFTLDERVQMARDAVEGMPGVRVDPGQEWVTQYTKNKKAPVLLRELGTAGEYEAEFQMALINKKLHRELETVFLVSDPQSVYESSRAVCELARFGVDVSHLVPPQICGRITQRLAEKSETGGK